jgi:hypothetical protein
MNLKLSAAVPFALLLVFAGCSKQPETTQSAAQQSHGTAAVVHAANQPKPIESLGMPDRKEDDPVLHGLKLGSPLDSQLSKCETRVDGGEEMVLGTSLCYLGTSFEVNKATGSAYVNLKRGGLSVEETAEVLKVSPVTAMRDWNTAKAWLYRELTGGTGDGFPTLETNR